MGACSSSGGMFANYAVVQGADKFMPVDIHVPGCPPRPEALIYGFNKLQRMIIGHPDLGWRRRYNAIGTEEWARDDVIAGQPSEAAEAAYARARQAVGDSAESTGPEGPGRRRSVEPGSDSGDCAASSEVPLNAGRPRARADRRASCATRMPTAVLGTYHEHGQACLIVDPEQVLAVLSWLRDTPGQEYRFLASVHGVDYLPGRAALRRPLRAAQPRPGRAHPRPRGARRPGRRQRPIVE